MDLGQVYFKPLKDQQGNVLLVTLREVTTPLTPSDPPLHWLPVSSLEKNQSETPLLPEPSAVELLTHRLKVINTIHTLNKPNINTNDNKQTVRCSGEMSPSAVRSRLSLIKRERVKLKKLIIVRFSHVSPGDAVVSQEESAESSAWSVCGHPETLQLRGSAPHPGPAAITQHAVPLPGPEPATRLTVRLENITSDSFTRTNRD